MYILRHKTAQGYSFSGYNGRIYPDKTGSLDLSDVIRFTKGEAERNEGDFVWFGCYKRTPASAGLRPRATRRRPRK